MLDAVLLLAVLAAPAPAAVASDPKVKEAVELATAWLEAQAAYQQIPGLSASIVQDQSVVWSGGFGVSDRKSGRAADADTLYSICSVSKLFTSVALLQQRDAGKLRLDDPVAKHLSWFRLAKNEGEGDVTLEGLLTHASGLPRESDFPYWKGDFSFPTREQIQKRLPEQPALFEPERHFQYSNLGLTLAGEVAAAAAAAPYATLVKSRILDPLGMKDTYTEMPEAEWGQRLAIGYSARSREGTRAALPFFRTNGIAPAAGFASTANDLGRFASWQFRLLSLGGDEILKATTLREMQRVHWMEPGVPDLTWGLGFELWRDGEKDFAGHGGSCPGYRTQFLLQPDDRIAVVVLANAQSVDVDGFAQRVYDLVAPALRAAAKDPGKAKAADASLQKYAGAYEEFPWGGETLVRPWEDGLAFLSVPTDQPKKELVRFKKSGENRFRRVRKDDSLAEEIVFEIGPDGRATSYVRHSNPSKRVR
jgi:CubicO group peptidase (beta-lactamase class C family)